MSIKTKTKTIIINLIFLVVSAYATLYVMNYAIGYYTVPDDITFPTHHKLCSSKADRLQAAGDGIYSDSGFRNESYTRTMPDMEQVWYDTVCSLGTYRENGKLKIKPKFNPTYKINSLGYRGREWDEASESGASSKVFILGGSTAFSFFNNENNTINNFLEKELNRKQNSSEKKYVIYTAALPAGLSNDEYLILRDDVIKHKPSTVVFLTGFNDSGRVETIYRYCMYKESPLVFFVYQTLEFLKFDVLKKLLKFHSETKMDNVEVFKKSTMKINKFCKKNKIRCIFALQPNVLNETYILSKSEERIKYLWERHTKGRGNRIKADDIQFHKWFKNKKNEFEYIDFRTVGSMGMFSGEIGAGSSTNFKENIHREAFNLFNNLKESAFYKVNLNENTISEGLCQDLKVSVFKNGRLKSNCSVAGYENLKRYISNNAAQKGYLGVLRSSSEYLDLVINTNEFMNDIEINVDLKNFMDRKDDVVEFSISNDGINFNGLKKVPKSQTGDPYTFLHELPQKNMLNKVYVRLAFRQSFHIGIDSIKINMNGKIPDFKLSDSFTLDNIGNREFFVSQRHKGAPAEIFIDAAHLTPAANKIIAEQISKKILNEL